jgi:hypothetical protein
MKKNKIKMHIYNRILRLHREVWDIINISSLSKERRQCGPSFKPIKIHAIRVGYVVTMLLAC